MSNWDILGGGNGESDVEDDVEYVGMEEVDDVVQEPMRQPRQAVRRVSPPPQQHFKNGQSMYPVHRKNANGVVGAQNRDEEDLVSYVDMPFGKQLGMTAEAIKKMDQTPFIDMDGQMAQRIEPGTYVMYGPNRAGAMGMGTNDWNPDGRPGYSTADDASTAHYQSQLQQQQSSGSGFSSWAGALFQGVGEAIGGVAAAVAGRRISQDEQRTERLRITTEQEAAASAREIAFREQQLEHETNLARIQANTAELEELRRQHDEAAALRRQQQQQAPTQVVGSSGPGAGTFIVIGLLGVGVVGGLVWFFGFRKNKDEE